MTPPPAARAADPGAGLSHDRAGPESAWIEQTLQDLRPAPTRGQRRTLSPLLLTGLVAAALLALWLRLLALQPWLDLRVAWDDDGRPRLAATGDPALRPLLGQPLQDLRAADDQPLPVPLTPPRWVPDSAERQQAVADLTRLGAALEGPGLQLRSASGEAASVVPRPRGVAGLGPMTWLLALLAVALVGAGGVVLLDRPLLSSWLYAAMASVQAAELLLLAGDLLPGLGVAPWSGWAELPARWWLDAVGAALQVHVMLVYPSVQPAAGRHAALAWAVSLGVAAAASLGWLPAPWWWMQGMLVASGLALWLLLGRSARAVPSPLTALLRRLTLAGSLSLALCTAVIAAAAPGGPLPAALAVGAPLMWQVFYASLLMLAPFVARSRRVVHRFALLAGVATLVAALDLLLVVGLGLGHLAAGVLALGTALALYLAARRWLDERLGGGARLGGERLFDLLYRAARTLEQAPEQASEQVSSLLRELFDPLELARSNRRSSRIRVAVDGSTLVVPIPDLGGGGTPGGTLMLRFAHQGRHLFTEEDVGLCQRLLEQLSRAAAYDRAVEQGRHEERIRIAQDLHDDIGARLLTLMYQAPNPEIEGYIRHTLQDLKTLTRGLSAGSHRLSHAAAEWKADIHQRLAVTGCDMRWSFSADREITLSVVQWSGITRVLRELVNNIIAHAQATLVEVTLQLEGGRLLMVVADDGVGTDPQQWSHGLGLGGVRKRVRLLGGQVSWQARAPRGIRCEVRAPMTGEA